MEGYLAQLQEQAKQPHPKAAEIQAEEENVEKTVKKIETDITIHRNILGKIRHKFEAFKEGQHKDAAALEEVHEKRKQKIFSLIQLGKNIDSLKRKVNEHKEYIRVTEDQISQIKTGHGSYDISKLPENGICIKCKSVKRSMVYIKCGHLVHCSTCVGEMCPMCVVPSKVKNCFL